MARFCAGDPTAQRIVKKPLYQPGDNVRVEKMSVMRRKIADHMVESLETSAHVYSAYEVDFSRVDDLRKTHKARYDKLGVNLTFTAFIAKAVAQTIREFPYVNASLDDDEVVYRKDVNLGIAVALEQGLIVPVIRQADTKSLLELARAIADLAERARTKRLQGRGSRGRNVHDHQPRHLRRPVGLADHQPAAGRHPGVGSIDKRPVVVDDEIVVRPMCYFTLGYDHRLVDGADAGRFLQAAEERGSRRSTSRCCDTDAPVAGSPVP